MCDSCGCEPITRPRSKLCEECALSAKRDMVIRSKARIRRIVREAKDKPCADCGVSYPYYVMDLDHRPGEVKLFTPAQLPNASVQAALTEIAKCDAVCANCHRFRTHIRRNPVGGSE